MSWWTRTCILAANDLRQELRHLELTLSAMVFVVVMIAIYAVGFASLSEAGQVGGVPAMLWLGVAFTGALTLSRSFDRERQSHTLIALLTEPVERVSIYFAKMVVAWLILSLCGLMLVAGLALLFPMARHLLDSPGATLVAVALGSFGYCSVGTLFAGGLAASDGKNLLFAVILYPITSPVLLYALVVTQRIIEGHPNVWSAMGQLAAVDAMLLAVGAFLFESVMVGAAHRRAPAQRETGAGARPRASRSASDRSLRAETELP